MKFEELCNGRGKGEGGVVVGVRDEQIGQRSEKHAKIKGENSQASSFDFLHF